MSSLFQASLNGNNFHLNPLEIAYGSKVTFKSNSAGGGLLHSHIQTFVTGSKQQQVTCYHHKDTNNDWIIEKVWDHVDNVPHTNTEEDIEDGVRFVNDGDIIRLRHEQTKRNLHSHNYPAPITTREYEVSCYGNETIGDERDHWRIEIVDDYAGKFKRIRSISTRFKLRHVTNGCILKSHSVTLPEWGFKQAEVVCAKKVDENLPTNMWNIELHVNDKCLFPLI